MACGSFSWIYISKVVSVTTNGSNKMIGKETGFANLFTKHVNQPLKGAHCIIHKETLCVKASPKELQQMMQRLTKVVITFLHEL